MSRYYQNNKETLQKSLWKISKSFLYKYYQNNKEALQKSLWKISKSF